MCTQEALVANKKSVTICSVFVFECLRIGVSNYVVLLGRGVLQASMGQKEEAAKREKLFQGFQVRSHYTYEHIIHWRMMIHLMCFPRFK